jgi:hypothetical protein
VDAATLITNIKSQALVGNTGSADDTDRVLRYLNKGYSKVYAKCAATYPSMYQRFQNMPINDGSGLFIFPVLNILSVADRNNNFSKITARSISRIQEDDFGLIAEGNPTYYDRILNGLVTYPRNSTALQLRYVPPPVPLTADTREIDIQVPPVYHEVLEWAALWTLAYDERDKLVGSELQATKANFDDLMEDLTLYLLSQRPIEETRVKMW